MASKTDKKGASRKNWVAPELKKTSIEQITANGTTLSTHDGGTSKPNIFADS